MAAKKKGAGKAPGKTLTEGKQRQAAKPASVRQPKAPPPAPRRKPSNKRPLKVGDFVVRRGSAGNNVLRITGFQPGDRSRSRLMTAVSLASGATTVTSSSRFRRATEAEKQAALAKYDKAKPAGTSAGLFGGSPRFENVHIDGVHYPHHELLRVAFDMSGMTVEQWNAQGGEWIDARLLELVHRLENPGKHVVKDPVPLDPTTPATYVADEPTAVLTDDPMPAIRVALVIVIIVFLVVIGVGLWAEFHQEAVAVG